MYAAHILKWQLKNLSDYSRLRDHTRVQDLQFPRIFRQKNDQRRENSVEILDVFLGSV